MKFGLIVLGVIFLVVGGILHYYPSQTFSAQTGSSTTGATNDRTSSAAFNVPAEWSYGLLIMGALFLIFGLTITNPVKTVSEPAKVIQGLPGPRGPRGLKGRKQVRIVRSPTRSRRRSRSAALPRGTTVETTTRIKR